MMSELRFFGRPAVPRSWKECKRSLWIAGFANKIAKISADKCIPSFYKARSEAEYSLGLASSDLCCEGVPGLQCVG